VIVKLEERLKLLEEKIKELKIEIRT